MEKLNNIPHKFLFYVGFFIVLIFLSLSYWQFTSFQNDKITLNEFKNNSISSSISISDLYSNNEENVFEFNKVVINNNKNLKFGAGYNSGLKKMNIEDDDFMILLNDDTIVGKDFIDELIAPFLDDKKVIITVPKILYSSNINKVWYAGGKIDLWRGLIYHIGIRDFDGPKYSFINETHYASGCCMCLRFEDFKKLNFFDETFGMYCEDCLLYTSPSPRDRQKSRMPSSA